MENPPCTFFVSCETTEGPFALPIGRLGPKSIITGVKAPSMISKSTLFALMSLCKKPTSCTWIKVLANFLMMSSQVALSEIIPLGGVLSQI